jgi:nucleotide-binding universal stress UspA family protein
LGLPADSATLAMGRAPAAAEDTTMRILIGVDGSRAAQTACDLVASRTWPVGTRVTLLGALERSVDFTGLATGVAEGRDAERAALELVLDERATSLRHVGLAVDTVLEVGHAAELLIDRADTTFTDLIVVGSRGLGPAASAVLGSVSAHLVDHAGCPVLVARSPRMTRMLLAADGTPSSRTIPRVLAAWGNAFRGMPVEVLSVAHRDAFVTPWAIFSDGGMDDELVIPEGIAEGVADEMMELGWHAAAAWRAGDPGRQIVTEGRDWNADLIVTGSRGIGTVHRLLAGSVAHDVLVHARSSVLVVRGQVPSRAREPETSAARASLA